jgi:hypothetical protein
MPQNNRGVLVAATAEDIADREVQARNTAEQRAVQNISDIGSAGDVHVRQLLPGVDLDEGADNDWTAGDDEWVQTGLSDGRNEVYNIDASANADDKVVVIFGVTNKSGSPITTNIEFETTTGGLIENLQIEGLETDPEDTLLFSDPVFLDPSQSAVMFQDTDEAGDDKVIYHGVVAEPAGETLEDSSRFLSEK